MKTNIKSNIWIPTAIILALVVLGVFLMPPATSPPGWDETHITFDSDEDMASYCNWLVLDTEGITVTNASRCLTFASSQDLNQKTGLPWRFPILYPMTMSNYQCLYIPAIWKALMGFLSTT